MQAFNLFFYLCECFWFSRNLSAFVSGEWGGGGGVFPYMSYIGMCSPVGYMAFKSFWS